MPGCSQALGVFKKQGICYYNKLRLFTGLPQHPGYLVEAYKVNVGDKLTIPFGNGQKEGVVVRIYDKSVWLKVDFPRHPEKLVKRKLSDLSTSKGKKKTRKSK
jgi:hypothetical protein